MKLFFGQSRKNTLNLSLKAKEKRLVCKISFCPCFARRTSALPTARWRAISKMPSKLRENTMPRRFAPRLFLTISQKVKIGGVFWTKFEHFLRKIRIPNFKIQSLGRAKRKGVGGKEFLSALAFRFQFFSAAAEFRISLCEMRRQKQSCVCPAHPCAYNKNSLVKIKEKMYSNKFDSRI